MSTDFSCPCVACAKDGKDKIDRFMKKIGADKLLEDILPNVNFVAEIPYQFKIRKGNDKFSLSLKDVRFIEVFNMCGHVIQFEEEKGDSIDRRWLESVKLILGNVRRKMSNPYWSQKDGGFLHKHIAECYAKEETMFL